MKLNVEVVRASRNNEWCWRVRSDDSRTGDSCLVIGLSKSEDAAGAKAKQVRDALAPLFTESYRSQP